MLTAADVIAMLELRPLPLEGGWYRETYRSADILPPAAVPRFRQAKSAATAIYYLITPDTCSALHRLPADELFHFYLGSPATMLQLGPAGARVITLGNELAVGHRPQVHVPAGVWQGTFLMSGEFALLGTTMAPGFDFADYEPGDRSRLVEQFPDFEDMICRLTPAFA